MDQKDISNLIIKHVGGSDNIKDLYHCMTRLRFKLNDKSKFDVEELKKVPGLLILFKLGMNFS